MIQLAYWRSILLGVLCLVTEGSLVAQSATDEDFFEAKIRPLLIEHCFECHGEKKQWNGLRLDSRESMLHGGDSGAAIVMGSPEESLLIRAVLHLDDLKMPPKKRLSDMEIVQLQEWVRSGAKWPMKSQVMNSSKSLKAKREHWAFQPITLPSLPIPKNREWCRNPIDHFVMAELERNGLTPTPEADRRTLIRRAKMDLTGLPASLEEIEAFEKDKSEDAYGKMIETILDSPNYGEQSARHWLDVARYSDTKGYVYAREERFFIHASTYRDWVIAAFNNDLPYDRFLLLQLAADQAAAEDRSQLAAMGFLTLGRRFLGVTHDIIDDRIDVVSRGTMGLTVSCARCHDHKYDPIPTADYYSLYGVFRNCTERQIAIESASASDESSTPFEKELLARQKKLADKMESSRQQASERARERAADYLFAQSELHKYPEEGFDQVLATSDLIPTIVRSWENYLDRRTPEQQRIFGIWFRFASLSESEFPVRSDAVTQEISDEASNWNALIVEQFKSRPKNLREVADRYGVVFKSVVERSKGVVETERSQDEDFESIRRALFSDGSPCIVPDEEVISTETYFDSGTCTELWKLQGEVDRWRLQSPQAPAVAVALVDRVTQVDSRLFKRGNPATKGDKVSRHFLSLGSDTKPNDFELGSGRLEMAQSIIAPSNPLTPRVWVNRLWLHHFGDGLVRTPSDFGLRAEPPSHPELLDWLAKKLIDEGWSSKAIHRLIMNSATYRQGSTPHGSLENFEKGMQLDPENRKLWRMSPRRLSFEEMRDAHLAASGELDRKVGGKASELFSEKSTNRRRSIYGLVDRQFLSNTLRIFDFANPDLHIPKRNETLIPQQSLFFLNHPFVANNSRALVANLGLGQTSLKSSDVVERLYRSILQRHASPEELAKATQFLEESSIVSKPVVKQSALAWKYGYGEVDEESRKLKSFEGLPHFSGTAWQGSSTHPDKKLGWVQLTASGGHPGNDLKHAAIRRWTAPKEMTIAIQSLAKHEPDAGDGIRCRILSSRQGLLVEANLHKSEKELNVDELKVQAGETIDFVVDIFQGLNSDQYLWAPSIRSRPNPKNLSKDNQSLDDDTVWDATSDFIGPIPKLLTPVEQLAQVLFLSNELMFVD